MMPFLVDFHIHSHFSIATSKACNPENLFLWACIKGLSIIGTGDFTHPGWLDELNQKLVPAEEGLYRLKPDIEKVMLDVMFKIPSLENVAECLITEEVIRGGAEPILKFGKSKKSA